MKMAMSRAKALEALELPIGADPDSIRTAYKRLAYKWFPEKYGNASEILKKFFDITLAYKRLSTDNEYATLKNKEEVYGIYFKVVLNKPLTEANYKAHATNGVMDDSDESDMSDDSEDDDDDDDIIRHIIHPKHDRRLRQDGLNNNTRKNLTPEEIERNAQELITEEEKEKRRAEKRRAKKKRQRQKKKAEKEQKKDDETGNKKKSKQKESGSSQSKKDKKKGDSSGSEAEDFDRTAAFFTQVVSKKKKAGAVAEPTPTVQKPRVPEARVNGTQEEKVEDLDPVILRSRQLAREGNLMASSGHYQSAIDLFTDACKLDPTDFRFFGNRSYCYDRIQQYEKALKDADKAISLASDWPKGYFRKGRALAGLKLYSDAEQAFMQVLKLDKNCEDAMQELIRVRTHQLTEMGFTLAQAEHAITQYGTVQQALDSLLAGVVAENSLANEIYESDEEDYGTLVNTQHPAPLPPHHPVVMPDALATAQPSFTSATYQKSADTKMDPKNPEGLTALWVGNVLPEVTQTKLLQIFSKYGTVTSIRMLPEKYCAFVNFKTKEAAGQAMNGLQGAECSGQKLLIKFPDNPINGNVVLKKGAAPPAPQPQPTVVKNIKVVETVDQMDQKLTGPVNGDECYFWRTTGCQFGKNCRWKHLPESKGKDRKPWQRQK